MDGKWMYVLIVSIIFIALAFFKKKHPEAWMRVQLPINIITSGLSLIMVGIIVVGIYQVVTSDINTTDKVVFVLFAVVFIAIFVRANYRFWCEWFRMRKSVQ